MFQIEKIYPAHIEWGFYLTCLLIYDKLFQETKKKENEKNKYFANIDYSNVFCCS